MLAQLAALIAMGAGAYGINKKKSQGDEVDAAEEKKKKEEAAFKSRNGTSKSERKLLTQEQIRKMREKE